MSVVPLRNISILRMRVLSRDGYLENSSLLTACPIMQVVYMETNACISLYCLVSPLQKRRVGLSVKI